jgi:hypothetical protein
MLVPGKQIPVTSITQSATMPVLVVLTQAHAHLISLWTGKPLHRYQFERHFASCCRLEFFKFTIDQPDLFQIRDRWYSWSQLSRKGSEFDQCVRKKRSETMLPLCFNRLMINNSPHTHDSSHDRVVSGIVLIILIINSCSLQLHPQTM